METLVRNRTTPSLASKTSITPRWPTLFRKPMHLKIVSHTFFCRPIQFGATWNKTRRGKKTPNVSGLYANVFRPAGTTENSKLPVVVVSISVVYPKIMVSELVLPVVLWRCFHDW